MPKRKIARNVPKCNEFRKASRNPQYVSTHWREVTWSKHFWVVCVCACTRQRQAKVAAWQDGRTSPERHRGNPLSARGLQPTTVHLFRSTSLSCDQERPGRGSMLLSRVVPAMAMGYCINLITQLVHVASNLQHVFSQTTTTSPASSKYKRIQKICTQNNGGPVFSL